MTKLTTTTLDEAMSKAFQLGQAYWQQADSDYLSQQRKSDATMAAFQKLKAETCERLEDSAAVKTLQSLGYTNEGGELWKPPLGQVPKFTTGHCKEMQHRDGCQLHNLHCGYPNCDRKPT